MTACTKVESAMVGKKLETKCGTQGVTRMRAGERKTNFQV
jgi:hypothetical protein